MELVLLIICLSVLLLIQYKIFKEVTVPSILISSGFLIASLFLNLFVIEWRIQIHRITVELILYSLTVFSIASYLCEKCVRKQHVQKKIIHETSFVHIYTKRLKWIFFFQVTSTVLFTYTLMRVYGTSNLAEALYSKTIAEKFNEGDIAGIPRIFSFMSALGTMFSNVCIILYTTLRKKHPDLRKYKGWLLCNVLWGIVACFMTSGGRLSALYSIVLFTICYIMSKYKEQRGINIKLGLKISLIAFVFLATFQTLGTLIGRQNTDVLTPMEIIVEYCGAEIQNLDDYLGGLNSSIRRSNFGELTFYPFYDKLGRWGILPNPKNEFGEYLPFNLRYGVSLGNVSTCLYFYHYDFGFVGTIVVMFILGFILHYLYLKTRFSETLERGGITISIFLFVQIIAATFMSFFSEAILNCLIKGIVNISFWIQIIIVTYVLYGKIGIGAK